MMQASGPRCRGRSGEQSTAFGESLWIVTGAAGVSPGGCDPNTLRAAHLFPEGFKIQLHGNRLVEMVGDHPFESAPDHRIETAWGSDLSDVFRHVLSSSTA
jgi:hypothetical protein